MSVKSQQHRFRLLCQNENCRSSLGAVHFACSAGALSIHCFKCGGTSEFVNGAFGIDGTWIEAAPERRRAQ